MSFCKIFFILGAVLVSLTVLASSSLSSDDTDLSRITPVSDKVPIPVVDFFRPQIFGTPKMNASGTHLAMVTLNDNITDNLAVMDLESDKTEVFSTKSFGALQFFEWLGDKRLLFFYDNNLCAVDDGRFKKQRILLRYCFLSILGISPKDPLHPVVWIRRDHLQERDDVGVVLLDTDIKDIVGNHSGNAEDMKRKLIENNQKHYGTRLPELGESPILSYMTNLSGELEYGIVADRELSKLRRLDNGVWNECPVDLERVKLVSCGRTPGELLVLAPKEPGKPRALRYLDATTGKLGDIFFQDDDYDFVGSIYTDHAKCDVPGVEFVGKAPKAYWFKEPYRSVQSLLDNSFPGLVTKIIDNDVSGNRFLVSTSSDRQPVTYHVVNLEKKIISLIANSEPWINPQRMRTMQIMQYRTRDGHVLDAYLTLPAGTTKQNVAPLIVITPENPGERYGGVFSKEAQFFASRGFAVLLPNVRSAVGYRFRFSDEDVWSFNKQGNDIADATASAISTGLVDSTRVGLFGRDLGALLAVDCAVDNPALYQNLCVENGSVNVLRALRQLRISKTEWPEFSTLPSSIGRSKEDQEKLDMLTPESRLDNLKARVLVIERATTKGGLRDDEKISYALNMKNIRYESLKMLYKVNYVDRLKQTVELYTKIEAFFSSPQNKPTAAAGGK